MPTDTVIEADNLSKRYMIGHQAERERYTALRDVITRSARNWARSLRDMAAGAPSVPGDALEEFWALKDVSFEIRRGDVVGVIGRNGAGKSTLLKVLSRITEPSKGRVEIHGRVASLLEVGTGFHPELTGRENIFLNGAILGMSRAEIKSKFDEIVAFSEVEKFLDTPVKRYSSGMYVRLAFAVAAHLEPEILIVDEVLAVGDAEFQKKCLGKMQDVAGHGRTVIFVSHNMSAVADLCTSGLVLNKGEVVFSGAIQDSIKYHMRNPTGPLSLATRRDRHGDGRAKLLRVSVRDEAGSSVQHIRSGCPLLIEFELDQDPSVFQLSLAFNFRNRFGKAVTNLSTKSFSHWLPGAKGSAKFLCTIPRLPLMPDTYSCNVQINSPQGVCDWIVDAFEIEVVGSAFYPGNYIPDQGEFMIDHSWQRC